MPVNRSYIAIDLKSFYASVECVERGLDPLKTNLVVADPSRTEKTICLAVSPSLKAYGISGRARLFEVVERVNQINNERLCYSPEGIFTGRSTHDPDLQNNFALELDYIVAPPRMSHYMKCSARIYSVYLRYVAPEDIHVYSIDEVFIDATAYLGTYRLTARQFAAKLVREVLRETGITATAGIGTNLYLAKVAMDIVAKHIPADSDGVRIAELDEQSYRQQLWNHTPLTDFWRVGRGTVKRLKNLGINTMGELARRSLTDENLLYRQFGVNAEMLIDHAWGWEPVTLMEIKRYRPETNSFSSGQVLTQPYTADRAAVVVREMADSAALKLVAKDLVTSQITLYIGYDVECLQRDDICSRYHGDIRPDWYGRPVPVPATGSVAFKSPTSSSAEIIQAAFDLYNRIVDHNLLVRRIYLATNNVVPRYIVAGNGGEGQLNLFDDPDEIARRQAAEQAVAERERRMQKATLVIKTKFGKNALLRGTDFDEGATARDRNNQIGGHKS